MHKLLFDQNLSYRIISQIEHLFPGSSHVRFLHLERASDLEIWQYAKLKDFHIVSKDIDFNDLNTLYGYPPKIISIGIGNTTTSTIINLLQNKSDLIHDFLDNKNAGLLNL
jgi:predicted nuclease of predicted toxin-antitoxin system